MSQPLLNQALPTLISDNRWQLNQLIRADHPSLAGHFPNAPIVPGVVLLDCVQSAACTLLSTLQGTATAPMSFQLSTVRRVKFIQPLRPEQAFCIQLDRLPKQHLQIKFCCRCGDHNALLAQGILEFIPIHENNAPVES